MLILYMCKIDNFCLALIEIMAGAFSQYRAGMVYAIQSGDFDAAIVFIRGMVAMLPMVHRPELPPIPLAGDIRADLSNKAAKWRWCTDSAFLVEESISKWIHTNLARMSM